MGPSEDGAQKRSNWAFGWRDAPAGTSAIATQTKHLTKHLQRASWSTMSRRRAFIDVDERSSRPVAGFRGATTTLQMLRSSTSCGGQCAVGGCRRGRRA